MDDLWTTFGPLLDHFWTTLDNFWTIFGPLIKIASGDEKSAPFAHLNTQNCDSSIWHFAALQIEPNGVDAEHADVDVFQLDSHLRV